MARRNGGEVIPLDAAREPPASAQAQPAGEGQGAPSLRDYVGVLLKRRWVVLSFFAVVLAGAAVWVWREPRVYRASCSVEISPTAPRILPGVQDVGESGTSMYWQTKEFFETQYQIIKSRAVAQRVVDKLGLASDAAFLGLERVKDPEQRRKAMEAADPAAMLQGMLRVDPVKDSRIVNVGIEDTVPERATRIANAVAEAYIEQNLDRKLNATRTASAWLGDQLDGLKGKLESSELNLHEFKKENDILTASYEDRQSITSQRLIALNDALTRIRIRRAELDAKMKTLAEAKKRVLAGETDALEAIPQINQNVMVTNLKMRLLALREEKAAVDQRYLEKHPKRAEVDTKLLDVRQALGREVDKVVRIAESEAKETMDTESQLRALIEGAKREAFETNKHEVDYTKLKREQENNQRLYDLVLQQQKNADLSGLLRVNNAQMLDQALLPKQPVRPNKKMILLLASFLGLLGGIGLALFFEYLDNTMKTHDDVEKYLGLPMLGVVPSIREQGQEQLSEAERGRNRDLYSHRRPKSSVAECIRSVRTNLLFMSPDRQLKRLLITSSGPQEGKTTVATNIAITMAQSGARVLLVDTDMRRPRVHRAFGLPNDAGISSIIVQSARLEDVVKETVVPNLFVLPCGPIPPNPSELIHTARFKQLLAELDQKYDRVIFDSPPVAAVTDALILSGEVDGVVMVVKSGRTVREVAMRTRQSLADVNARIFGVVINDLDLERRGYGYYYYYQKYGYYYGEKPSEA